MTQRTLPLKYGENPQKTPAQLLIGEQSPNLEVLNGSPSYINILDALNGWQLVRQLKSALGLPAAASFKHVSPAGAAVSVPLSDVLKRSYFVEEMELSPLATAYARARGADRVSSFGDFIALSDVCDVPTAMLIAREVSDGVIAPGFSDEALGILQAKRGGRYLVLRIDPSYQPPAMESREIFGVILRERRDDTCIDHGMLTNIVTYNKTIPPDAQRDLIVALVTLKYTQSNSVCFALDGQAIGVGAGQQSRVHCTRLAGSKADLWHLRQHPRVLGLEFREGLSRADKNNTIDSFLSDELTPPEKAFMESNLARIPEPIGSEEKNEWIKRMSGVSLASDAFFPFRDSIDRAGRSGVEFVVQTGGSNGDDAVIAAANEYGMAMVMNDVRLFHH